MIILKSCPACGNDRIVGYNQTGTAPRVLHEIIPGIKVDIAIITRYCVCQDCNLIFQNPRMSDLELDKYYSRGYYRQNLDATEEETITSEKERAAVDGGIIKNYVGKSIGSHLDIGCGRGFLFDEVGASIKTGIEPEVSYVRVKGIDIYPNIKMFPPMQFDLVTVIHVLEHVPYPLDFLKKIIKFVSKNGYLVIEVPSWESPGGPLRLAHLSHFEPDVLKLMCAQVGLQVIHEGSTPHLILICKGKEESLK